MKRGKQKHLIKKGFLLTFLLAFGILTGLWGVNKPMAYAAGTETEVVTQTSQDGQAQAEKAEGESDGSSALLVFLAILILLVVIVVVIVVSSMASIIGGGLFVAADENDSNE